MKVTVKEIEPVFAPVEITLTVHTKRELEVLFAIANVSPKLHDYINSVTREHGEVHQSEIENILVPIFKHVETLLA